MNRIVKTLNLGNGHTKHKTRLETDECSLGTPESRFHRFNLLRTIADDPNLTACGGHDFDTAHVFHDGARWVLECEANT